MSRYFKTIRDDSKVYLLEEIANSQIENLPTDMYISIDDSSILSFIDSIESSSDITVLDRNREDIYTVKKEDIPSIKFMNISYSEDNKVGVLKKARSRLESISNKIDMIDYIRYIDANNELNARGFFITDNNKETKFLEILELGDENLIDVLESFLTLRDSLSILKNAKIEYDKIYEKILITSNDDVEKLQEIADAISK